MGKALKVIKPISNQNQAVRR